MYKSISSFEVTEVDTVTRRFKGIASTPSVDRAKDILLPSGATFKLPLPLLLHHDSKSAVGSIITAIVTEKGIEVELEIPEVPEEGIIKSRTDEAYHSLKYKLIKGLSVGFLPDWDKAEENDHGGVTFKSWEWYELSLVSTPCNPDAVVSLSKEFEQHRAALSNDAQGNANGSDMPAAKRNVVKLDIPNKGGVKL